MSAAPSWLPPSLSGTPLEASKPAPRRPCGDVALTATQVGVEVCTPAYWTLTLLSFVVLALITAAVGSDLARRHREKEAVAYVFEPGDIGWTAG